jgi:hypothetical protein
MHPTDLRDTTIIRTFLTNTHCTQRLIVSGTSDVACRTTCPEQCCMCHLPATTPVHDTLKTTSMNKFAQHDQFSYWFLRELFLTIVWPPLVYKVWEECRITVQDQNPPISIVLDCWTTDLTALSLWRLKTNNTFNFKTLRLGIAGTWHKEPDLCRIQLSCRYPTARRSCSIKHFTSDSVKGVRMLSIRPAKSCSTYSNTRKILKPLIYSAINEH